MDYEKKYNELLARIQAVADVQPDVTKQAILGLFPELKESERIKQAIVDYFKAVHKKENIVIFNGVHYEDILAWLEKQGEQPNKVSIWKHWKNGIAGNGEWKLVYLLKSGNTYMLSSSLGFECDYIELSELDKLLSQEKQGEQKPVDKVEPKFKIGDTVTVKPMSCHGKVFKGEPFKIVDIIEDKYVSDDGKTYSISLQDGWELVVQKPVWSEEDENGLGDALWAIQQARTIAKDENDMGNLWCAESWLKSLKDRCLPQPKQEWSEEDEKFLDYAIKAVHNMYVGKDKSSTTDIYIKTANWLNSLNPQNRWKPNEEQIEALDDAWMSCDTPNKSKVLSELLEQLKAL